MSDLHELSPGFALDYHTNEVTCLVKVGEGEDDVVVIGPPEKMRRVAMVFIRVAFEAEAVQRLVKIIEDNFSRQVGEHEPEAWKKTVMKVWANTSPIPPTVNVDNLEDDE